MLDVRNEAWHYVEPMLWSEDYVHVFDNLEMDLDILQFSHKYTSMCK